MNEVAIIVLSAIAPAVVAFVLWQFKKLTLRVEDTYKKHEVSQIIDLKLGAIHAEIHSLKANNVRVEAQIARLETKIDKLLEKLSS